jgi:hypothetical protein
LRDPLLQGLLEQLEEEGLADRSEASFFVSWDAVYELMAHEKDSQGAALFELPSIAPVHARVSSKNSLEDPSFEMAVGDWRLEGRAARGAALIGAILQHDDGEILLPAAMWSLAKEIRSFSSRPDSHRNGSHHRQAWGKIRRLADCADAGLDDFLHRTVVLTPEKLTIGIRKIDVAGDKLIEIMPSFDSAPHDWLDRFDRQQTVQERYDIPTAEGIVQVLVSPKVRTVLTEIKRLPLRRVAGARAQAFVLNPFAALGEDASQVIDEQQFEQARAAAGLDYERFLPQFKRDAVGYPLEVGLLIETASPIGPKSSETRWLDDDELTGFVRALNRALTRDFQLLAWEGFDFELQGDSAEHLRQLSEALEARRTPPVLINFAQIYDLAHYAARVEEIGVEKPYYSLYIARKRNDEGWFPENIVPIISWRPEGQDSPVGMPLGPEGQADLRQKVAAAEASGKADIPVNGCPTPMPLAEAKRILETLDNAVSNAKAGTLDPSTVKGSRRDTPIRKSPVIRPNIDSLDYAEDRAEALDSEGREPILPAALRPNTGLLPHQRRGVAWLQTLFEASEGYNCRGAVLADDMGLGKTLQLLTLIAWALECKPDLDPVLVVAPLSLLENWREEVDKFFVKDSLPLLTAYGDDLLSMRVPRESIDQRLREDGLVKFLRPDWLGTARVVLTTYETLRDLEFSFARQRWSMMICDEAQKIKNPSAMVTRAAKKQNVQFRIACTGTPVENTLADLWCLFDFVQPGLLGALNAFGRKYRRPIEARTDQERVRVEELRRLVAPQILRRIKADVADDLPKKLVNDDCRHLPLSNKQRDLYARAIELFKKRTGASVPFKNHLGLLHYLRLICTDPRRHGLDVFVAEPLESYRLHAPKLDWLLKQLKEIKSKEEKAIVFCEFRNIQRLLQHYVSEVFGIRPDIINGDTAAAASHAQSRQKRLRAFQQKPGFGVLILSPVAVGFGLNIQAANHVVHYTRTWNPAKEDQATDRAYRIGQTKDVFVYYPVVRADDFVTFDVKLDELLEYKRSLAFDMLNGAGDVRPGDFNIDEVVPGGRVEQSEQVTLEMILSMNWEYFEALAAVLYSKRGFETHRTAATKDNGIDVVALGRPEPVGKLIQAKASSRDDAALDWDAVKDVVGGQAFYERQFPGVSFGKICITNQRFNERARQNATLNGVELIEQPQLLSMLEDTPVTMVDIERVLFTDWTQTN